MKEICREIRLLGQVFDENLLNSQKKGIPHKGKYKAFKLKGAKIQ